ncbi:MAG: 1-deoxy-D-xylulose-5-phosphate synthase [Promethearchaeota archaeon]|nr:MAG: 1-deoxy-D-xylulose-5-phosphate synthase [Candidatus Lokiarchaeota archaeon]
MLMNEKLLRDAFGDFLAQNGDHYPELVVLDADLSSSTRTNRFAQRFPRKFFNFGIAEQNMMGAAIGFAISGKMPVVSGFSIFTTGRAWEFIRLICHDNLNVKIITTHGGLVGEDGSTHNALEDLSLMGTLPNISILIPSDIIELKEMLKCALNSNGPFYIRLPRGSFQTIHNPHFKLHMGSPEILKEGKDICLIGIGSGASLASTAAEIIERDRKISIKVINLSTIKPINVPTLISALKNVNKIIIIEEHNTYCGAGSILTRIISEHTPKLIKVLGIEDSFGESGSRVKLLEKYGFTLQNLLIQMNKILDR